MWFGRKPFNRGSEVTFIYLQIYTNEKRLKTCSDTILSQIRSVDLSPTWLVSGSWDRVVRIWSRVSGNCLAASHHHSLPVTGVHINETGKLNLEKTIVLNVCNPPASFPCIVPIRLLLYKRKLTGRVILILKS